MEILSLTLTHIWSFCFRLRRLRGFVFAIVGEGDERLHDRDQRDWYASRLQAGSHRRRRRGRARLWSGERFVARFPIWSFFVAVDALNRFDRWKIVMSMPSNLMIGCCCCCWLLDVLLISSLWLIDPDVEWQTNRHWILLGGSDLLVAVWQDRIHRHAVGRYQREERHLGSVSLFLYQTQHSEWIDINHTNNPFLTLHLLIYPSSLFFHHYSRIRLTFSEQRH